MTLQATVMYDPVRWSSKELWVNDMHLETDAGSKMDRFISLFWGTTKLAIFGLCFLKNYVKILMRLVGIALKSFIGQAI